MTDNVVELMTDRVTELAGATQTALQSAAVIGNRFELALLAATVQLDPTECTRALDHAVQTGLILPLSDKHELVLEGLEVEGSIAYRFLHDRVQQATFSLLSPAEVTAIHRQVGRLQLVRLRERGSDEDLFEAVGHLNFAVEAETDAERRLELAHLNLEAGRKARASNAYEAAADYVEAGLRLLPPDPWGTVDDLTFELHLLQVEVLAVLGDFERSEPVFAAVLKHAATRRSVPGPAGPGGGAALRRAVGGGPHGGEGRPRGTGRGLPRHPGGGGRRSRGAHG